MISQLVWPSSWPSDKDVNRIHNDTVCIHKSLWSYPHKKTSDGLRPVFDLGKRNNCNWVEVLYIWCIWCVWCVLCIWCPPTYCAISWFSGGPVLNLLLRLCINIFICWNLVRQSMCCTKRKNAFWPQTATEEMRSRIAQNSRRNERQGRNMHITKNLYFYQIKFSNFIARQLEENLMTWLENTGAAHQSKWCNGYRRRLTVYTRPKLC